MRVTSPNVNKKKVRVRKMSDEEKRETRLSISDRLAAGELSLGEAARLMRLSVGKTQVQYAKILGIDLRVLANIEKGVGNPRLDTLEKIAKPFGLIVSFVKPAKK